MAIVEGLRLIHRKNELVGKLKEGTLTDSERLEMHKAVADCRHWLGVHPHDMRGQLSYGDWEDTDDPVNHRRRKVTLHYGEESFDYGWLYENKEYLDEDSDEEIF
jgi:hypothetical protein